MALRLVSFFAFAIAFYVLIPSTGFATSEVIGDSLCNVVGWMHGKTGKALVVLAMVITGVMALLNKITWGVALIHLVGEALVLEASIMVSNIAAGGVDC